MAERRWELLAVSITDYDKQYYMELSDGDFCTQVPIKEDEANYLLSCLAKGQYIYATPSEPEPEPETKE